MKKTTKILSGTLLVALISLGLATKMNVKKNQLEVRDVLEQNITKPTTGKVVRRANEVAENKVSEVKAQVSEANEGKRHIRFVAAIDSASYSSVKFDIVAKDGETVVKTFADKAVSTAYTHVETAGEVLSAAAIFGEEYNYLVAFTINNVPESAWAYTFEVSASVKVEEDSEYTTSNVATKVINDIIDADEVQINIEKEVTLNGVVYKINQNKTVTVQGYTADLPNAVELLSEVEGYPVKEVGIAAFMNAGLTSLVVPEGVTKINDQAFHSCKSLASVTLPSSLTYLGRQAFYVCVFPSIVLPSALTYLGQQALRGNKKLASVTFENNVSNLETIDDGAFYTCQALVEFEIPATVTKIGKEAFLGCSKLTNIYIPSSVTTLGAKVFNKCNANLVIDCGAESKPEGWDANWSTDDKGSAYTINWGM